MCTPVWDVSAANHRGQIGDRVASHADFVELGVLANQMTAQETTMGAPRNYYLLRVELATFQNTFNSKLVGRKTRRKCKRIFVVVMKERHMEMSKSEVQGGTKKKREKFNITTIVMSHDLNKLWQPQLNIETIQSTV